MAHQIPIVRDELTRAVAWLKRRSKAQLAVLASTLALAVALWTPWLSSGPGMTTVNLVHPESISDDLMWRSWVGEAEAGEFTLVPVPDAIWSLPVPGEAAWDPWAWWGIRIHPYVEAAGGAVTAVACIPDGAADAMQDAAGHFPKGLSLDMLGIDHRTAVFMVPCAVAASGKHWDVWKDGWNTSEFLAGASQLNRSLALHGGLALALATVVLGALGAAFHVFVQVELVPVTIVALSLQASTFMGFWPYAWAHDVIPGLLLRYGADPGTVWRHIEAVGALAGWG